MRLACALLLAAAPAAAQEQSVLAGRVQTMGTREPLPSAVVHETETDEEGRFELGLPPGPITVRVTAAGHRAREFHELLVPGQRLEVVYRLERNLAAPYETTVRDQRARTEVARVALTPAETHELAGTMGEPLRAVLQLPGVASVVSGLAYPVVRGTQPAASAYFLDGIRIPQLFHALAGPSVIHPDFIDRIEFFPGVAPARFGRLLGGAIEAQSARPVERVRLTASIDLINASAFALLPIEATGTSVTVAARLSYTPLIGARVASALFPQPPGEPPRQLVANFYDYQARIEQKLPLGKLRLIAFGAGDEVGTRPNGSDSTSGVLRSLFHRIDLSWSVPTGGGTLELAGTWGRDVAALDGQQTGMREVDLAMSRTLGSARISYAAELRPGLALRAGGDAEYQSTLTDVTGLSGSLLHRGIAQRTSAGEAMLADLYLQMRLRSGSFETLAGLRADVYLVFPRTSWFSLEPRLEERLHLGEHVAVRAAAGLFHQPPTLALAFPVSDVALLDEGLQWAAHTEVGVDVSLPLELELGLTAFYDPLFRTLEHPITELLFPAGRDPARSGSAYGVELFLRRAAAGRWFGWLSATLQRSERLTQVYSFGPNGEVEGSRVANVAGAFDQTLVLHAVAGVQLPRGFSAGVSLHFNTGRPESGEISSRQQRPVRDDATGMAYWQPQDLDRIARLPPFFRADVRVSKVWTFDDWLLEVYLDVMNASVSREVLGYDYRVTNGQLSRAPLDVPIVLPMLGVKGRY